MVTGIESHENVALLGGAKVSDAVWADIRALTGPVVAADGGARHALNRGVIPDAVIGDMDSLAPDMAARIPADRLHLVSEQQTTDFDKALRHVRAPLVIGAGFSGARADHALAAYTVLARHPDRPCALVGEDEVVTLCPPRVVADLPVGSWFSLYPLGPVTGRSQGLEWAIDGLAFDPAGQVGTSNRVTGPVVLELSAPLMLAITPRAGLPAWVAALRDAPARWPSRAG